MQNQIEMNKEETLLERINRLKAILDDMCREDFEHNEEKVNLSSYLDQLICEYMRLKKNDTKK